MNEQTKRFKKFREKMEYESRDTDNLFDYSGLASRQPVRSGFFVASSGSIYHRKIQYKIGVKIWD